MAAAQEPSKKYDQDFFLDLAAKGKDAWNAWRPDPANKDVRVTFKGVDFSEPPRDQIDFSGFEFGDYTDFSACKWRGIWVNDRNSTAHTPGRARFTDAAFGTEAKFTETAFGDCADFSRAAFGEDADFSRAAFGENADFAFAAFDALASFFGAAFGHSADFTGTAFGAITGFINATFERDAEFIGATFGMGTSFGRAVFDGIADFTGAAFGGWPPNMGGLVGRLDVFEETHFKGFAIFIGKSTQHLRRDLQYPHGTDKEAIIELEQRHEKLSLEDGTGPDRFLYQRH